AGVNVSAVVASVGITGSKSINGESKSLTDYVDLNGDRYPDIVTTDQVQATNRTGGLYPVTTRNESYSGNLMFSNSHSWGAGATGSFAGGGKSNAGTSVSGKFSLSKPMMSKPQSEIPSGNSSIGISSNYSGSSDEATTLWTDINGDGLYDQVVKNNSDVTIKLNYGNNAYNSSHLADWGSFSLSESASDNHGGGFGISLYSGSIEGGIAKSTNTASQQYTLQDMNGDGLLDIVITDDDKLNVGYNYGTYFAPDTTINDSYSLNENSTSTSESQNFGLSWSWITYFFGVPIKFPCINGNYQHQVSTNRVEKSVTDFDGDGFPDLLEEVGNNTVKVYYSTIRRTNKLKTVHNPLGGSFTVDYQPVVKDYNNPNAKWVMSSVIVDDGYDLVNDGSDTIRKYFEYENGKYDRREREFYGFETVKTIDYVINPDGTKGDVYRTSVQKYYNQSYFLNGLLKEQYVYQGDNENNLFSQTENVYVLKTMQSLNTRINLGSDPLLTFDVGGTEGRRTAIALLSETYNRVYELGASPIVSHLSFEYDNQGRVVNYINDPNVNLANDDYTTAITYYSNQTLTDKNITNIPSHITVTANSVVKRERETGDIDNNTGAIGTILAYIDATTTAETSLDYDTYGNLSYIEFPPNSDNQQMSYTYTYDVDNAKYIESITDAAGYTSSSVYDPKFDALLQTTDITGNKIYYAYDDFGRLTKITGPNEYGIGSDPFTLKFEYYLTLDEAKASYDKCLGGATVFMPLAITRHYDPQHVGNSIDTYTFIDGLGRPVQIKKDIELVDENGYQPSRFEAMSVSGKASYDCFGRVVEQFHPTWEAKDCSLNLVVNETAVQYSSQTEYDELDRPVQTTDPDGNIATTGYSVSGNYAKTRTVVDQNGSQSVITETYKDAQGNVAQTVNVGPSGNVVTAFSYDAIGQLLSYTDADNLTSSYTYDRLGRKLSFSHPDNGLTSYVYDLAGNLSQMQTANLAVTSDYINYTYDYNRLTEVEYPEVGGNPNIANTTFEYGGPAAGNNAGRLVYQSDASGEQSFEYGNMGEVVSTSRTVVAPSPSLPTRTFKLQFAYDSWNRIQSMSYPDYEEVAFAYDLGGNLIKVTGKVQDNPYDYLQDVYYDYYEQRTYVK
ncbi:MAG TPA: toxin TcdB middle/N-terminal domain-containing protein, partial [Bacteroidales bacterium]|nr:toxin TcdB middle/N-terminal domain-containing protein [Bacteroidales bacterium]